MSNILCGLDILEDSEIANQIAIIEVINNIKENTGIKEAGKKILKFASYFTSIFKDNEFETEDYNLFINEKLSKLNTLSRDQLVSEFKKSLCSILDINEDISEDKLCINLINNVCDFLGINLDEMPLNKSKNICEKYYNFINVRYHDSIYKLEDKFSKYTKIDKKIIATVNRGFSIEKNLLVTKDYIYNNGIKTVVSETLAFITFLLSVFSLDRIYPKINEFKVSYDKTFEEGFNDLLLKIKNSNAYTMANNQKIVSLKHDLRGLSSKIKRDEKRKNDCMENLSKLKLSKENLSKDIKKIQNELEKKEKNTDTFNELDENAQMEAKAEVFKLQKRIDMLKNKLKNINNEGLYAAKSLDNILSELNSTNDKIKSINTLLNEVEEKNKTFIKTIETDKIKFQEISKKRVDIIKDRWTKTFNSFTIKEEIYNSIKDFNSSELFKIEMALLEMSKMDDVSAISAGKIDKFYDYVILNTSKREPIKIYFEISPFGSLTKIEKIEKDMIII